MAEQSHRDEMNAAIRAQRERHAAPRTIAPGGESTETSPAAQADEQPEPAEAPEPLRRSMLDRLRGR